MKNKKVASMCVALGLVAVVGVGGTLAYLSDATGTLTNTFIFVDKGIDMKLDEKEFVNGVETGKRVEADDSNTKGSTYANLVPGQIVEKDPTVTILKNSLDCWVFASVVDDTTDALEIGKLEGETFTEGINSEWQEVKTIDGYNITNAANTKYYVYVGDDTTPDVVTTTTDSDMKLEPLFNNVQFAGDETGSGITNKNVTPIVIKSAAIQSGENDYDVAAADALGKLGATVTPVIGG